MHGATHSIIPILSADSHACGEIKKESTPTLMWYSLFLNGIKYFA